MQQDEQKSLVDEENDETICSSEFSHLREYKEPSWLLTSKLILWVSLIANVTLSVLSLGLVVSYFQHKPQDGSDIAVSYSPANSILAYENRNVWNMSHVHMGPPGPEMEAAWAKDLEGSLIRITEDELTRTGARYSIPLTGGGYAAGLGVSHNLHCLKRIKKYIYKEHYFPNVTAEKADEIRRHTEHCLEGLRQAVLCYADPSLLTVMWENSLHGNPGISSATEHKCVNWETMHGWMIGRAAKQSEMLNPDLETTFVPPEDDSF